MQKPSCAKKILQLNEEILKFTTDAVVALSPEEYEEIMRKIRFNFDEIERVKKIAHNIQTLEHWKDRAQTMQTFQYCIRQIADWESKI